MRRTTPPEPSRRETHKHQWDIVGDIIIEDGAVHVTEECRWVDILGSTHSEKHDETFYEEGAECDATRRFRLELAWLEKRREGEANVQYLGSEIDHFMPQFEAGLIEAEMEGEVVEMDRNRDDGVVVVETDDWRAKYKADCQPQVER